MLTGCRIRHAAACRGRRGRCFPGAWVDTSARCFRIVCRLLYLEGLRRYCKGRFRICTEPAKSKLLPLQQVWPGSLLSRHLTSGGIGLPSLGALSGSVQPSSAPACLVAHRRDSPQQSEPQASGCHEARWNQLPGCRLHHSESGGARIRERKRTEPWCMQL